MCFYVFFSLFYVFFFVLFLFHVYMFVSFLTFFLLYLIQCVCFYFALSYYFYVEAWISATLFAYKDVFLFEQPTSILSGQHPFWVVSHPDLNPDSFVSIQPPWFEVCFCFEQSATLIQSQIPFWAVSHLDLKSASFLSCQPTLLWSQLPFWVVSHLDLKPASFLRSQPNLEASFVSSKAEQFCLVTITQQLTHTSFLLWWLCFVYYEGLRQSPVNHGTGWNSANVNLWPDSHFTGGVSCSIHSCHMLNSHFWALDSCLDSCFLVGHMPNTWGHHPRLHLPHHSFTSTQCHTEVWLAIPCLHPAHVCTQ